MARILSEAQLRHCIGADHETLAAIELGFRQYAEGRVEVPPVMHISVAEHGGDVDIKSAFIHADPTVTVKVGSGYPSNVARGLPTSNAMMVVLSAQTGACEAVLLDNGYLTDLRTALAGAVAAKCLANPGPQAVGVIGVGAQARWQLRAISLARPLTRVVAFGRDTATTAAFAAEMAIELPCEVEVVASAEDVVRLADLIVTTTSSREPLIHGEWLHPGHHVTAVGSDLPGKQELHESALRRADFVACDDIAQCRRLGEAQWASDQDIAALPVAALGDVLRGNARGRTSESDITICDLTGLGMQDAVIARIALQRATLVGWDKSRGE